MISKGTALVNGIEFPTDNTHVQDASEWLTVGLQRDDNIRSLVYAIRREGPKILYAIIIIYTLLSCDSTFRVCCGALAVSFNAFLKHHRRAICPVDENIVT